jgi:[CysO sulfur-carrier protein]-S-L-cysteine hydrolase
VPATPELREAVLADCRARAPAEAVGVVLVDAVGGQLAVPLPNRLPGAAALQGFEVAPGDWMALERRAAASGQRLGALYHSHPHGPLQLSDRDRRVLTPGGQPLCAGLELWLVGPAADGLLSQFRCFRFSEGAWHEVKPLFFLPDLD